MISLYVLTSKKHMQMIFIIKSLRNLIKPANRLFCKFDETVFIFSVL